MFFLSDHENFNKFCSHKYQMVALLYALFEASLYGAATYSNESFGSMLFLIFPVLLVLGVILQKEYFFTLYMAYNRFVSICYFLICFASFFLALTMPSPYTDFMRDTDADSWFISLKTDHDIFQFTMALHIFTGLQAIFLLLIHYVVERASGEIMKKLVLGWDEDVLSEIDNEEDWGKHPYIYDY